METSLRELFGARLVPLGAATGRSEYRFADASGRQVEFVFDGSRRGVTVYGRGGLAQPCAIDPAPGPPGGVRGR